jgi:hypothetical protein
MAYGDVAMHPQGGPSRALSEQALAKGTVDSNETCNIASPIKNGLCYKQTVLNVYIPKLGETSLFEVS